MKKLVFLCIVLTAAIACQDSSSPTTPAVKHANVIMLEGPIFEDGYSLFEYKGRVKNTGEATASFAKIYIYVRKSDSSLLAQADSYVDDTELTPQETSAWDVLFWDEDHKIRDTMDSGKLTYELKWDED